jgi:hypothetical protein
MFFILTQPIEGKFKTNKQILVIDQFLGFIDNDIVFAFEREIYTSNENSIT